MLASVWDGQCPRPFGSGCSEPSGARDAARRSGFTAKMASHPAQIPVINRAFSVSEEELVWAHKIVAAFAENPEAGTLALDGKMVDRPHLTLARRLLGLGPA